MSDAIEVATLLGAKVMRRSDISSYHYYFSKTENGVSLISRNPAQSGLGISLLNDQNEKILRIPLTFDRDQEFDNWITSLPCELGQLPLPKRRNN
jgi:hypothetical protein